MPEGAHALPAATWGLCPFLHVGPWQVPAYGLCMTLALAAGAAVYVRNARSAGVSSGQPATIVAAALLGGVLGAKIPIWLLNLGPWLHGAPCTWRTFLSGRTIVGGLVGGMLTVWAVKHRLGIRARYGNLLAPAIALGLAIGRVGCLLTGFCAAYFGLRFLEEFIRPGATLVGLTPFQWICLAGLALLAVKEGAFSRSRPAGAEVP